MLFYLKSSIPICGLLLLSLCGQTQTTFTEQAAAKNLNIGGSKDGGLSFGDIDNDGDLDVIVNTND